MAKDSKKKKKRVQKVITTRAQDGSFGHEHIHEGESTPIFAGTSRDMKDLHQHMDDHLGPEPAEAEAQGGEAAPQEEGAEPEAAGE